MVRMTGVSGGTTDAIDTAPIAAMSTRRCWNSPTISRPTSSAVRSRSVCRRQLSTSVAPSKTPTTMFVFPTSIAKSMTTSQPFDLARDDPFDAIARSHAQRALIVDAGGDARHRARVGRPRDARAVGGRRVRAPGVENSIEPAGEQVVVPARERSERLDEHLDAIDRAPGLRLERRCAIAQRRRKGARRDVDPVAHDDVGLRCALRENAPELPARDAQIVRPLEID